MPDYELRCVGPGPHIPESGVLGTVPYKPKYEVRCPSSTCTWQDVETQQQMTRFRAAQEALTQNDEFLNLNNPSAAQVTTQVRSLTRQASALIRMALQSIRAGEPPPSEPPPDVLNT